MQLCTTVHAATVKLCVALVTKADVTVQFLKSVTVKNRLHLSRANAPIET